MPSYPRGALKCPRHKLAAATPHEAGPYPASFFPIPPTLHMWGNDRFGDCVTAEEAAAKAVYSVAGGQPELLATDTEVIEAARAHGGLNGAYLTDVMDWMARDGMSIGGTAYKDGGYTSVNWADYSALCSAISQGPVKIGVAADQLESVHSSRNGWWLTSTRRDPNTDHCVSLVGYGTAAECANALAVNIPANVDPNAPCVLLFTWGSIGIVIHAAVDPITTEAWLRTPTTIGQPGPTPIPPTPTPTPPSPWHCPWSAGEVESFVHSVMRGAARGLRTP